MVAAAGSAAGIRDFACSRATAPATATIATSAMIHIRATYEKAAAATMRKRAD
jgi:hypothetical protein